MSRIHAAGCDWALGAGRATKKLGGLGTNGRRDVGIRGGRSTFLSARASTPRYTVLTGGIHMEDQVYTLGVWHVKEGHEAEFIAAWKDLGRIFASLPQPPSDKGLLIQSTTDPTLFYSFGPWRRSEDVAAMRADPSAQAGIKRIRAHCIEATPGTFRVVAESA